MSTHALTITTDETTATRLAEAMDMFSPAPDAISLFEVNEEKGEWGVAAYFSGTPDADAISSHLAAYGLADTCWEIAPLPSENWVEKSLEGLKPVFGGRYKLFGSHDADVMPANISNIEMDAGQAFGTGHHGTTRGCLMLLDEIFRLYHPKRVFDLGTGTGVLAIAAAKTLRQPVLASDIDPISVMVTNENAHKNGVFGYLHTVEAVGFDHPQILRAAPFDLIIANILAGPLKAMSGAMRRHTVPGSLVLLSGIMERQAASVIATYRSQGFRLERRMILEGWATLLLSRT